LPPDYGDSKNVHRRFCRWRDNGVWENLLEQLVIDPDYEWLMIDATHIKVHPHASSAVNGNQDMSRTKEDLTRSCILPWMRMACRSSQLLQRGPELRQDITTEYLLADKAHDSDEIVHDAEKEGMQSVIPPKKNRISKRFYDKHLLIS